MQTDWKVVLGEESNCNVGVVETVTVLEAEVVTQPPDPSTV